MLPILISIQHMMVARWRLIISCLAGFFIAFFLLPSLNLDLISRYIIGWNLSALLFVLFIIHLMFSANHTSIRARALVEDEGQYLVLAITVVATITAIAAVIVELASITEIHGNARLWHIALTISTILATWIFTQFIFALYYAHFFYLSQPDGKLQEGLIFPGTPLPDYADFLYFSCIIGTSAQTADVSFSSSVLRRIGTIQCILAFFFNTTILALTINIASDLI
ncbi:DUF1345 domain-containing protein [Polynucleobacter sp. IMCC 29146]|uniref:DUF1345 domain-containing protein n=1 Tax=Polynucleobacter sp. IMCC 29146 TaxID=2780953 RepID=UPI001F44AF3D|nr:DUF1345 domain-containing protein [Polynucleobacter sp. IMCC 29146]MCE7530656.1 DUF1345 domain-containing protein [Polynucleobacter sp. IMCC 29146]